MSGRFAILLLVMTFAAHSLSAQKEADVVERLNLVVPDLMTKADVPGLSITILRDGKSFWNKGFGAMNSQTKEAVTENTVFEAASLSKPVFAYSVLKLVDQGKIDLDAPLNTYLPGNYDAADDSRIAKITARRVLSHTTGFPNWRQPRNAKLLPIHFEPGDRFSYSGEGFVYLSKVVEAITKMPFESYVRESVFQPLGMNSTSFEWQDRYKQLKTFNHDLIGNPSGQNEDSRPNAAGSLLTTTADYSKFIAAVLNGTGLKKETRSQMLAAQSKVDVACRNCTSRPVGTLSQEVAWGVGVGLQQTADGTSFWHWGDNGDTKAFFIASDKNKDGIVIFTNSANGLLIVEDILAAAFGRKYPALAWINPGRFDEPARVLLKSIVVDGADRSIAEYKKKRETNAAQRLDEARVNSLGYDLLRIRKVDEAIALFTLNTQDFPKSANTWDSLGEAFAVKGDTPKAIEYYKRSLALNPENKGAAEAIKRLEQ